MCPAISIVCAAYNRAEVLRYAILSVLQSDFTDWELLVIGDCCTDDSEAVVRSFGDRRISFENLPTNSGGQAVPNNLGVARARGEAIFFLNQDDMYLRGHLAQQLGFLRESGADVVWSPMLVLRGTGAGEGPPDPRRDSVALEGVTPSGNLDPEVFVVASSWAMTRQASERFGPWRGEKECRITPSQDWLFRAEGQGARLIGGHQPSVLCLFAGERRLSYRTAGAREHARAWSWIENGAFERELLACAALNMARQALHAKRAVLADADFRVASFARAFGLHPVEVRLFLDGMPAGGLVEQWRRRSFDAPPLAVGTTVAAGAAAAAPYFGDGWHRFEGTHRWSAAARAELAFAVAPSERPSGLRLKFDTLQRDAAVRVWINGRQATLRDLGEAGKAVELGRPEGAIRVVLEVDACPTPKSLGINDDERELGVSLSEFEVFAADVA